MYATITLNESETADFEADHSGDSLCGRLRREARERGGHTEIRSADGIILDALDY